MEKVITQWREVICRHCDSKSRADPCELDKAECTVLRDMPDQLLGILCAEIKGMG